MKEYAIVFVVGLFLILGELGIIIGKLNEILNQLQLLNGRI